MILGSINIATLLIEKGANVNAPWSILLNEKDEKKKKKEGGRGMKEKE